MPRRTATVVARSSCECYAIAGHAFLELLKGYPQAKKVFSSLAEERRRKTDAIQSTLDASKRMLSLRGQFGSEASEAAAAKLFQAKMRGILVRKSAAAQAKAGPAGMPERLAALESGQKRLEDKLDSVLQVLSARDARK